MRDRWCDKDVKRVNEREIQCVVHKRAKIVVCPRKRELYRSKDGVGAARLVPIWHLAVAAGMSRYVYVVDAIIG